MPEPAGSFMTSNFVVPENALRVPGSHSKWSYGESPWLALFRDDEDQTEDRSFSTRVGPRASTSRTYSQASATRSTLSKAVTDTNMPPGYCWPYNRGEQCRGNCGYEHKCHRCDGDHRGCHCPKGPSANRHKYMNRKPPANPSKCR
jgi:hypothetical protein